MTYPILYSFRRCPYAMRARLAIRYAGVQVELREIVLKDKPTQMLAASPKGTVPVLVQTDGTVLDESLDIMSWALKKSDPEGWQCPQTFSESIELIRQNDFEFKPLLDRYKYADRHPERTAPEHREASVGFPELLNQRLTHHTNLLGNHPSLADAAISPFIRQYALVDKDWFDGQPYPELHRWLKYWMQSELFNSVMKKYDKWDAQLNNAIVF